MDSAGGKRFHFETAKRAPAGGAKKAKVRELRAPEPVRLRRVASEHVICSGGLDLYELLPKSVVRWIRSSLPERAGHAILALQGKKIIGFLRYDVLDADDQKIEPGVDIRAAGTWVHPNFRRRGIAARLWRTLVRQKGVYVLSVCSVNRASFRMLHRIQGDHPFVQMKIDYNGD